MSSRSRCTRSLFAVLAATSWNPGWLTGFDTQKFALGFDSSNYLFQKQTAPSMPSFNTVQAQINLRSDRKNLQLGLAAEGHYTVGAAVPLDVEVNEAFIGSGKVLGPVEMSFGRKLEEWSDLDSTWRLGIWQPRFMWDFVAPSSTGLTGLFAKVRVDDFEGLVFGSYLFVPERGGPLTAVPQDGTVVSGSRFFTPPPSSVTMMGATIPVNVKFLMPEITQLLFHPSLGARVRYGGNVGFWGGGAYAFKPINQMLVGYDGILDLNSSLLVTLIPRVRYHHVASLEAGYRSHKWSAALSALVEIPSQDQTDPALTVQRVRPSVAAGPVLQWMPDGIKGAPRVALAYLAQAGGNSGDEGILASPGVSMVDDRYPYQQALLLEAQTDVASRWFDRVVGSQLVLRSRVIGDLNRGEILISPQAKLRVSEHVALGLGADIFAVGTQANAATLGFIGKNVENTRIYGRLSYGF